MGTPPKACQHPQSPKGTFPATPAASRDQRPWTAAGRRPSWGVLRSSWGLSPWQNPLEPTGTSTSRSGPKLGLDWKGWLLAGDRGTSAVAPRGRLGPCTRARCWVGTRCPRIFCMALPGTAGPRQGLWARRSTVLPANTPQALAAFPRFAGRPRKGAGDGSRVCRQLRPAQDTVTAQHGSQVRSSPSPAVGDSKMQITQLRHHPGSVRWRVLECTGKGGRGSWLGAAQTCRGYSSAIFKPIKFLSLF